MCSCLQRPPLPRGHDVPWRAADSVEVPVASRPSSSSCGRCRNSPPKGHRGVDGARNATPWGHLPSQCRSSRIRSWRAFVVEVRARPPCRPAAARDAGDARRHWIARGLLGYQPPWHLGFHAGFARSRPQEFQQGPGRRSSHGGHPAAARPVWRSAVAVVAAGGA